jgi:hypothetical protein
MATTIAKLLATLGLDASDFERNADKVKGTSSKLGTAFTGLSNIGGAVLATGFATATAGAIILGRELYNSIQEAADAQKIQAQLEAVLKSTGGAAGVTSEQVNELATSLSEVTAFEDDVIVSGQNMLLTFTNIGRDVFPQATETILDMSTALGQDLQSSAVQLGKALNDPIAGVSALSRVGVTFTEEQKEQIKTLVESGDVMGAQTLILQELQKEFGGSAKAAGETFAGQLSILQNKLGNIRESIGEKLLPVLLDLATTFSEHLSKPETQAFIQELADNIANLAKQAVSQLPAFIELVQNAFGWLMKNKVLIIAAVALIGSTVLAFLVSTAAAAWAAAAPFLPIIAAIALVGVALYWLYTTWSETFTKAKNFWMNIWKQIEPIFSQLKGWLDNNIPTALGMMNLAWNNVLAPLRLVWSFIQTNIMPIFRAVGDVIQAVILVAFRAWVGYIQNIVIPALRSIWDFIQSNILPVFQSVSNWINNNVVPAFNRISDGVQRFIDKLRQMRDWINSIRLPWWLTPGSPTPLELGLVGVRNALQDVNRVGLPIIESNLSVPGISSSAFSSTGNNRIEDLLQTIANKNDLDEDKLTRLIRDAVAQLQVKK